MTNNHSSLVNSSENEPNNLMPTPLNTQFSSGNFVLLIITNTTYLKNVISQIIDHVDKRAYCTINYKL